MDKTKISVEFSIIGDVFPPDEITRELSVIPTDFYLKGEKIKNRNIERKETCWYISTEFEESLDVNNEIKKILNVISGKREELKRLKKVYDLQYKFFVVINIEDNHSPAIYLNSDIIEFANEIKAEFDFDLYIY